MYMPARSYTRYQLELSPTTSKYHFQGYYHTGKPTTLAAVVDRFYKLTGIKGHFDQCKTKLHGCNTFHYTDKLETRVHGYPSKSFGDISILPGYITGPPEAISEGDDGLEWTDKKQNSLGKTLPLVSRRRDVELWLGQSGVGKTCIWEIICSYLGGKVCWLSQKAKASGGRWFSSYAGQDIVVIDEFNPADFSEDEMKIVFGQQDRMVAKAAGGKDVKWTPRLIVLLSNRIDACYSFLDEPHFKNRITHAYQIDPALPKHHGHRECIMMLHKRKISSRLETIYKKSRL